VVCFFLEGGGGCHGAAARAGHCSVCVAETADQPPPLPRPLSPPPPRRFESAANLDVGTPEGADEADASPLAAAGSSFLSLVRAAYRKGQDQAHTMRQPLRGAGSVV